MMRSKLLVVLLVGSGLTLNAVALPFGTAWIKDQVLATVSNIIGRDVTVAGELNVELSWTPSVKATKLRVANAAWSDQAHMVEIESVQASIDLKKLLEGQLSFPELTLNDPKLLLEVAPSGVTNWQLENVAPDALPQAENVAKDTLDKVLEEVEGPKQADQERQTSPEVDPLPFIGQLQINGGRVSYRNRVTGAALNATLDSLRGHSGNDDTWLKGEGAIAGRPVTLDLQSGSLSALREPGKRLPVSLDLDGSDFAVAITGSLRRPFALDGVKLALELSGRGTPPFAQLLMAADLPQLPDYRFSSQLRHGDGKVWRFNELRARFGASDLRGGVRLKLAGPRPTVRAELRSNTIDIEQVTQLLAGIEDEAETQPAEPPDLSALQKANAEIDWTVDELLIPGGVSGEARAKLQLTDGDLSLEVLRVGVAEGTVALRGQVDATQLPATGWLTLALDALDVSAFGATGDDMPTGTLAGKIKLNLTGEPTRESVGDLALPGLGRIAVEPSQFSYTAPAMDLAVNATMRSTPLAAGERQLAVDVDGRYRGEPFTVELVGDSPLALRDPEHPYALDLNLQIADNRLAVEGWLQQPLTLSGLALTMRIDADDLQRLQNLVDYSLPDLPPLAVVGELDRRGDSVKLTDFYGTLGDSDISGDLRVELGATPLTVYGNINSRRLDLEDFADLIGAESESDDNVAEAPSADADVLPDTPLNLHRLSDMVRGRVVFRGRRLEIPDLPLDQVAVTDEITENKVRLDPLAFDLADGSIRSTVKLNTRERPVAGQVDAEIRRLHLGQLLAPFEIADDTFGTIGGRAKFWVHGNTLAELFASADGGLFALMTGGRLDALLVELAGLDLGEALVALAGNADPVPIDCAYFNLHARDGIAEFKDALVDTRDTLFLADGFIDFNQELIDLVVNPRPKDFSLLSFRSPLHMEGKWGQPSIYPGSSGLARGAAAAVLAVVAPPAALLPLLEPGNTGEPVRCDGLIEAVDRAR